MNDSRELEAGVRGFVEAAGVVEGLVAGVRPEQWSGATPCTEWDVRQLVAHLVLGNRGVATRARDAAAGRLAERQGVLGNDPDPAEAAELLGSEPAATYAASAREVAEAFGDPDLAGRTVRIAIGDAPAATVLTLRTTDTLVHGWDLARATGRDVRFEPATVEACTAFARDAVPALSPGRSGRRPFGTPTRVPEGASELDALAALLGRTVEDPLARPSG